MENTAANPHQFWKEVEKRNVSTAPPPEKRPSKSKINANIEKLLSTTNVPTHTPISKASNPSPVLVANTSVNGAFDFWRKVAAVSKQDDKEMLVDPKARSRPEIVKKHLFELEKDVSATNKSRSLDFITDTDESISTGAQETKRMKKIAHTGDTYEGNELINFDATNSSEELPTPVMVEPALTVKQTEYQVDDPMLLTYSESEVQHDVSQSHDESQRARAHYQVEQPNSQLDNVRDGFHRGDMHQSEGISTGGLQQYDIKYQEGYQNDEFQQTVFISQDNAGSEDKGSTLDDIGVEIIRVPVQEGLKLSEHQYSDGSTPEDVGTEVMGEGETADSDDIVMDMHVDKKAEDIQIHTDSPNGLVAAHQNLGVPKLERHTPIPATENAVELTKLLIPNTIQDDTIEHKKKKAGKLKIFSHKQKDKDKDDKEGKEKLKLNLSIFKHKRTPSATREVDLTRNAPRESYNGIEGGGQKSFSLAAATKRPIFGVDLSDLVSHNDYPGVPLFVVAALQILANSESGDVDYLFSDSSTDHKIHILRQQIDQGLDISQVHEVRMVAGLLKLFFLSFPVPLLGNMYKNFADIQDIDDSSVYLPMLQSLLWSLPPLHMALLQFFVKFLREKYVVATQIDSMEYVMNKLGAVFGPVFMRNTEGKHSVVQNEVCRSIIAHYETLFMHRNAPVTDMRLVVRNGMLILEMASTERIIDRMLDVNYSARYGGGTTTRKWKLMRNQRILDILRIWIDTPTWDYVREDKQLISKLYREFTVVEQWLAKSSAHHKPSPKSALLTHFGMTAAPRSKSLAYSGHNTSNVSLLDHDLFLSIRSIEWVKFSEGPHSAVDAKLLPHIVAFQKQSIQWGYWAGGEIVKEGHLGRRVLLLIHFVTIAQVCYDMGNYNTAYSVIVGLAHPSVRRLEATWQLLPKNIVDQFSHLLECHNYEMAKNIADMFHLLKHMKPPCVPYFGIIQKLFANMDESNPIHPREYPQLVDLDRLRTVYGILDIFAKYDKVYSVKIVPRIYIHLQETIVLTPEQLISYSLKCEEPTTHITSSQPVIPPEREAPKTYKTPTTVNHWTTEVQRIWAKPFDQLPIGIDLPRLATLISVGSCPSNEFRRYIVLPAEPSAHLPIASAAALVDGPDTRARDILEILSSLTKFIENEEYSNNLQLQFSNYVLLDGAKDRDMSREIAHLFEYLGKDCKVARVLKAINQAIIAPPIIELTLNVCSKLPFRDAGGWRIFVHRHATTNQIVITHVKRQKARSHAKEEVFEFEWRLEMVLDGADLETMADVSMKITDIGYGEALALHKKAEVDRMLGPYTVQ